MNNYYTYAQFKSIISIENGIDISYPTYKMVYNVFKRYPDQNNIIRVEELNKYHSPDEVHTLKSFGIIDAGDSNLLPEREYVVILKMEDIMLLQKYLKTFCSDFLPKGVKPTAWFVDDKVLSIRELEQLERIVREEVPGIKLLNRPQNLVYEALNEEILEKLKESYKASGIDNFIEITSEIKAIDEAFKEGNTLTLYHINKLIDTTKEKYIRGRSVLYSKDESETYLKIAAILTTAYGYNFIFKDREAGYRGYIADLCYNPEMMLAKDWITYLAKFPTFTFKATDFSAFVCMTFERKLKCRAYVCNINMEEKHANLIELDINDGVLKSLEDIRELYGFNTSDRDKLFTANARLKDLFHKFSEKLPKGCNTPNPCNTLFITDKSTDDILIAYIPDESYLNFTSKTLVYDHSLKRVQPYSLSLKDLKRWIPLSLCEDAEGIKNLLRRLMNNNPALMKEVKPQVDINIDGSIIRYFYLNGSNNILNGLDISHFVDICLNNRDSVQFRKHNKENILGSINSEFRKHLNCFGCFDNMITDKIKINERTFIKDRGVKL